MAQPRLSEELDDPFLHFGSNLTPIKLIGLLRGAPTCYVADCGGGCGAVIRTQEPRASMFGMCTTCLLAHTMEMLARRTFNRRSGD